MAEEIIAEQPKAGFLEKLKIHTFKILGGILGVFIFAGAVFGAYKFGQRQVQPGPQPTPTPGLVATPTPDLTANWKTYTNEKYSYSIKYPTTWFVSEKHQLVEEVIFSITKELKAPTPLSISVRIDENPNNLTLKQWVDGIFKDYPPALTSEIRREPAKLEEIEAERIYVPGEGSSWRVIALSKNRFYSLNIGTIDVDGKGEEDMNLDTFNLILSTFRFLGEEGITPTVTPTPAFKTYKDQEIGYSITYPVDWSFRKTYGKDIPKLGQTDVVNGIEIYKPNQPFTFVLNVIDKKGTTSVVDWWNQYSPNRLSPEEKIDRPNFSFKGNDAVKRSGTPGGSPPSRVIDEIHFLWKDYIYFLALSYSPYELNKELLDIAYSLELP